MIKLFDIQNNTVIPTVHCYTIYILKDIMDNFPDEYIKIYSYLFYMTCPNPEFNPYFHMRESEKEEIILKDIDAEFSPEEDMIVHAMDVCRKLYETETSRAYEAIKTALDNVATYMKNTAITDGRDGNISQISRVMKEFDDIRQSYKGVFKDLQEEQRSTVRGNIRRAYDDK